MSVLPPFMSFVITFTQRVPPLTVVDSPPTARSVLSDEEPKLYVPLEALLARLTPPEYMVAVEAAE